MVMFKRIISVSLIILLGFIFPSCMKEVVNPKLPSSGVRLSLQCYLSPDDSVSRAYLYLTRPLVGKSVDGTTDYPVGGRVLVTDGTDTAWFERRLEPDYPDFPINRKAYAHVLQNRDFPFVPGRTYKVVAMDTTGRQAWGSCTIPLDEPPVFHLAIDTAAPVGTVDRFPRLRVRLKWPNLPGNNFYRALVSQTITRYDPFEDTVRTYQDNLYPSDGSEYLLKDESFGADSLFTVFNGWVTNEVEVDSSSLLITLLQTDRAYYDFNLSLSRYWDTDFFSEPTQVYGNVQNGVGVVSAYRTRTVRRRIR